MSNNSSIKKCTCKHEFQDKTYGNGNRVFNKWTKGWRCTVCERVIFEDVRDK